MNILAGLGIDPDALIRHIEGTYVQDALRLYHTLRKNSDGIAGLVDEIVNNEVAQWQHYKVEDMVDEPPDIRVRTSTMKLMSKSFGLCSDTAEQIVLNLLISLSQLAARLDTADNQLNKRGLN